MVKHEEQHAQLANILSKATTANARKLQTSIKIDLKKMSKITHYCSLWLVLLMRKVITT